MREDPTIERMLTTTQAGKLLGFSGDVVRRMCEAGRLLDVRRNGPSGQWRIPSAAVQDFIEKNRPRKKVRLA